jgi:hypothetical protein
VHRSISGFHWPDFSRPCPLAFSALRLERRASPRIMKDSPHDLHKIR